MCDSRFTRPISSTTRVRSFNSFNSCAVHRVDAVAALGERRQGSLPWSSGLAVEAGLQLAREGFEFRFERRVCRRGARSGCTNALPTTTASTCRPSSATCSGLEMPKPTASGRSVTARMARTSGATAVRERILRAGHARARDQIDEAARVLAPPAAGAARVLVGAARKTVSRSWRVQASTYAPASSTLASVSRQPSIPAARGVARQRLEAIAQHRVQVGEQQHVESPSAAPDLARRSPAPLRSVVPACSARSPARWITGPSATDRRTARRVR